MSCKHTIWLLLAMISAEAKSFAQNTKTCLNGEKRDQIDVAKLSLQYQAPEMTGSAFGSRLTVSTKTLQIASQETQKYNELIKALAVAYNACAIGSDQFSEGLRLGPLISNDFEGLRKAISPERDRSGIAPLKLMQSISSRLSQLAEVVGRSDLRADVDSLTREVRDLHVEQEVGFNTMFTYQHQIISMMEAMQEHLSSQPNFSMPPTTTHVYSVRVLIAALGERTATLYEQAVADLNASRYKQAVSKLETALSSVRVPEIYVGLCLALRGLGNFVRAEEVARSGLALPDVREGRSEAEADLLVWLGATLFDEQKVEQAQEALQRALQLYDARSPDHAYVASATYYLGLISWKNGSKRIALDHFMRSLTLFERMNGPDDSRVGILALNVGIALKQQGKLDQAQLNTERAIGIYERLSPAFDSILSDAEQVLGEILLAKHEPERAAKFIRHSIAIKERLSPKNEADIADKLGDLATALVASGEIKEAEATAQHAISIYTAVAGGDSLDILSLKMLLGVIRLGMRDCATAERYLEDVVRRGETAFDPKSDDYTGAMAYSRMYFGIALVCTGDRDNAHYQLSLARTSADQAGDQELSNGCSIWLANLERIKGNTAEAEKLSTQALAFFNKLESEKPGMQLAFAELTYSLVLADKDLLDLAESHARRALSIVEPLQLKVGLRPDELRDYIQALARARSPQH